jgi:hypothetical protein
MVTISPPESEGISVLIMVIPTNTEVTASEKETELALREIVLQSKLEIEEGGRPKECIEIIRGMPSTFNVMLDDKDKFLRLIEKESYEINRLVASPFLFSTFKEFFVSIFSLALPALKGIIPLLEFSCQGLADIYGGFCEVITHISPKLERRIKYIGYSLLSDIKEGVSDPKIKAKIGEVIKFLSEWITQIEKMN